MNINNAKLKRNLLFCLISAIESDIRKNILNLTNEGLTINEEILLKLKERYIKDKDSDTNDMSILINYLDIGDYVQILNTNKKIFSDIETLKCLITAIETIIPTRNRIMHVRPLEFDDDVKIIDFVGDAIKYSNIIKFDETILENKKIKENPDYLLSITPGISRFSSSTIKNNLPMVDYDDTGFIGRINDKEQLKKKILGPYPVISVIGVGGIGKTSLLLSTLYDLLEDSTEFNSMFDYIIWITLKTKSMTDGDFIEIKKAITNINDNMKKLPENILDKKISKINELLQYMTENRTLLIIDNLETLDKKSDINKLFEEISNGSKILITSRIGIGNYEQTYHLDKLSDRDALLYFRKLASIYKVSSLIRQNDTQIKQYLISLDNNPLAIKWFVINVGKGMTPNSILSKEISNLTDFCLSNIYEKLSNNAKYILRIISIKYNRCSLAELLYLCELSYDECMESVNELFRSNFLIQNEDFSYSILDFAVSYIQNIKGFSNSEVDKKIQQAIKSLNGSLENLKGDIHLTNEYHPLSLFPKNDSERIATLYVLAAIKYSKQKNFKEVDKCLTLASNSDSQYSDIYKIAGYLYSKFDSIKSEENYKIAISLADNKAPVHYFYAGSLMNNQKYDMAEYEIKEAMRLAPDNKLITMSYARLYKMQKKYADSLDLLQSLKINKNDELHDKMYIKYLFEMIDTRIRYAESLFKIDNEKAYNLILENIKFIDTLEVVDFDFTIYNSLFKLLHLYIRLLYFTNYDLDSLITYLFKYHPYILAAKNGNKKEDDFNQDLDKLLLKISSNDAKKIKDIISYTATIKEENFGYIISLKESGYGFIKPASYTYQTIYFHCSQFKGDFRLLHLNDRVSFKLSISDKIRAIDVKLAAKEIIDEENEENI